jgi:hypothetical protein
MLSLIRITSNNYATLGVLVWNGIPLCMTMELPWRENHHDLSCIPAETYRVVRSVSEKFGETLLVTNVPGRTGILFHAGIKPDDTHGCILVGSSFSLPESEKTGLMLFGSLDTKHTVLKYLCGFAPFNLNIIDLNNEYTRKAESVGGASTQAI